MSFDNELEDSQSRLKGYVRSVVYNKEDADDIVQNTNAILIKKKPDYDKDKNFFSWAINIAKFQIKAYFTKRKRNREDCYEELKGLEFLSEVPFANLIHEERMEIIKKLNSSLTTKELTIFDLLTKGLTNPEICAKTGYSYGAVSALKRRVIKKIKKTLKSIKEINKFDYK
tara:strand:- start:11 stop:523 length:513 start_codon:yes stop_codon:yes gene_type:complete